MNNEGEGPAAENPMMERFVTLFTTHQRRIFHYILALVSNTQDAEDILQETNLVLWRKFATFKLGTNFFAWASTVAHFEVLKFRKRAKYRHANLIDDELLEKISFDALANENHLDAVRETLHRCLEKLKPVDRDLLAKRYVTGASGKSIALSTGRPTNSISKSLGRIRRALLDCVKRTLALENRSWRLKGESL